MIALPKHTRICSFYIAPSIMDKGAFTNNNLLLLFALYSKFSCRDFFKIQFVLLSLFYFLQIQRTTQETTATRTHKFTRPRRRVAENEKFVRNQKKIFCQQFNSLKNKTNRFLKQLT